MSNQDLLSRAQNLLNLHPEPKTSLEIFPEKVPEKPSVLIQRLVTFYQVRYDYEKAYPTKEIVQEHFQLSDEDFYLHLEKVNDILVSKRDYPPVENPIPIDEIDPDFVHAVHLVTDPFNKASLGAKMKNIGKTTAWFNTQLKKPINKKYYDDLQHETYGYIPNLAKQTLTKLVESGDLQALKYAEEKLGIYRPNQQAMLDFTKIISQLMEVLVTYLKPEQLEEIASKFERIIDVNSARELGPGN